VNVVDLGAAAVGAFYVGAGFYTGVVRRAMGLAIAYLAFMVATNMGQQGGQVFLFYQGALSSPDARAYGFLAFFLLIVGVLEGAAIAVRDLLEVSFVLLNRSTGIAVGLLTAGMVVFGLHYMAVGFAHPEGGAGVTMSQIRIRDALDKSHLAQPVASRLKSFYFPILDPVLPREAGQYFGSLATNQP
jgi:uncharacterized membrane protein required for colicin V production